MKKLIVILTSLLVSLSVLGQGKSVCDPAFITSEISSDGKTIEYLIQEGNNGDYNWIRYVHFFANSRIYILSFEPMSYDERMYRNEGRNVYLYSKDTSDVHNSWEKSSELIEGLTCAYKDAGDHTDIDFSRAEVSKGSVGTVNVLDNSVVEITVGVERMQGGRLVYSKPETFVFTPISNNQYLSQRK